MSKTQPPLEDRLKLCNCITAFGQCFHLTPWQVGALERIEREAAPSHTLHVRPEIGHGVNYVNLFAPLVVPSCRIAVALVGAVELHFLRAAFDRARFVHYHAPLVTFGIKKPYEVPYTGETILHVIPHARLSHPDGKDLLRLIGPDLVIVTDDFGRGGGWRTTRAQRLTEYMTTRPVRTLIWGNENFK